MFEKHALVRRDSIIDIGQAQADIEKLSTFVRVNRANGISTDLVYARRDLMVSFRTHVHLHHIT